MPIRLPVPWGVWGCVMRDLQARAGPGTGPSRPVDFYLGGCHFLALRADISLVQDDLTRKTVPKPREEPLCLGKLCLNRDICVCCPGGPRGTWTNFQSVLVEIKIAPGAPQSCQSACLYPGECGGMSCATSRPWPGPGRAGFRRATYATPLL